ncbi:hypothetical protein ES703_110173 [subsurface metagenome]
MMPGMIMLWAGAIVDIPSGWHLCDGDAGTPDLRHIFVLGASSVVAPGSSGGSASHQHDFTGDGHAHNILEGTGMAAGTDFYPETDQQPGVGTSDLASTEPPWYALSYIMKLN